MSERDGDKKPRRRRQRRPSGADGTRRPNPLAGKPPPTNSGATARSTKTKEHRKPMAIKQSKPPMTSRQRYWQRCDMISLSKESSSAILLKAQDEEELFLNAMQNDRFLEDMYIFRILLRIIYMMVTSTTEEETASILVSRVMTDCGPFVSKLRSVILDMVVEVENLIPSFHQIVLIATFCVERIPSSTMRVFPHADLKDTGHQVIPVCRDPTIKREFKEYCQLHEIKRTEIAKAQEQQRTAQLHVPAKPRVSIEKTFSDQIPPENFRDCYILPQPHEINNHLYEPFLRPNLVSSDYLDPEHYLDVQFRLLREDFVGPLRDGIQSLNEPKPELTLYHGVRVLVPVCLFSGVGFQIQFDTVASGLEQVRWEHSRKLIYGSLLCFSYDGFRSVLFATVVSRNADDLKDGQLVVKFEGVQSQDIAFAVHPSTEFLMVESSAYFEAYRHVLEGLQEITSDQMPFRPYIVGGHCFGQPIPTPVFLRHNSKFDLNDTLGFSGLRKIDVANPSNWPKASQTNLDESQLAAIKMALSQEISIIQGPPGTGKTFIGLKIVQALLQNRSVWDPKSASPILVVCYTNHALDQFLEEILKIQLGNDYPKIVRVGGRCKSENLKPYVLSNIVKCMREEWRVPKNLYSKYKRSRVKMNKYEEIFEKNIGTLELSEGNLASLQDLSDVINHTHFHQLVTMTNYNEESIEMWLGLVAFSNTQDEEELLQGLEEDLTINSNTGYSLEDMGETGNGYTAAISDDELIEIADEPLLLEEDRKEDHEEEFERKSKQRKRKGKKKQKHSLPAEGEWEIVTNGKKKKKVIKKGLKQAPFKEEDVLKISDIWMLNLQQRWKLYIYWLNKHILSLKTNLCSEGDEYNNSSQRCFEINQEINTVAISNVHVIGMTTTGAAKYSYILKNLRPKILIVEEAAEVMEPHIITSLCSSVQQLVLIGDHKQLQPKPAYYSLERKYNFNISLFERLIRKGFPCVTLTIQHRMRPEIARIVGNHIYDELNDSQSVQEYEHIKGVEKSLFFIEHKHKENNDSVTGNHSRSNTYEAQYIANLTQYFLKQGYKPQQITILTMYRGQLIEIKQKMRKSVFGGVRVAAVDDFQGEENDIIILSLVRSNSRNSIGFLKVENRVCVALSRARKGMFVIGDFSMLRGKSETKWPAILVEMERKGFLGESLPLCCHNHPQEKIMARIPSDFSKSPAGGCRKRCTSRLKCGHLCPSMCHPDDPKHEKLYKCAQKCDKVLGCGHNCTQRCYECKMSHALCKFKVQKMLPKCSHTVITACSDDLLQYRCTVGCNKTIASCGHKCTNTCSEECVPDDKCTQPCQANLDCSHKCKGTCGACYKGRLHVRCKEKCGRTLNCGHICDFSCPEYCPPCFKPCGNYCFHSKCPKKCYEPCVPCREPCKWECIHYKCTKKCGEKCNRPRCDKPCYKALKCGHPCIGLCGEDCPSLCRICNKDEVTEVFFGTEDKADARFIRLKDCRHVLEVSGLDRWMDVKEAIQFKECPKCKTPIRRSLRYGNIVKGTLCDIEKIKLFHIKGSRDVRLPADITSAPCSDIVFGGFQSFVMELATSFQPFQFDTLQNQLNSVPKLFQLIKCIRGLPSDVLTFGTIQLHKSILLVEAHRIMKFMKVRFLSAQQIKEVAIEFCRVFDMSRLCEFRAMMISERKVLDMNDETKLNALVLKNIQGNTQEPSPTDSHLKFWRIKYRVGELTNGEYMEIFQAMSDVKKGSWFKCPQGHVYCVGECGGAVARSKCPECHAKIGGIDHQLIKDNMKAASSPNSCIMS